MPSGQLTLTQHYCFCTEGCWTALLTGNASQETTGTDQDIKITFQIYFFLNKRIKDSSICLKRNKQKHCQENTDSQTSSNRSSTSSGSSDGEISVTRGAHWNVRLLVPWVPSAFRQWQVRLYRQRTEVQPKGFQRTLLVSKSHKFILSLKVFLYKQNIWSEIIILRPKYSTDEL